MISIHEALKFNYNEKQVLLFLFLYTCLQNDTGLLIYFFFFNWLIHNSLNLPLLIFVLQSLKTHLIEAAQRYFLCYRWITSRYSHNPSILDRVNYDRVPNTFYKFYEHYSWKHYIFGQCNDNFDRSCNQIRLDFSFFIRHVYFTMIL